MIACLRRGLLFLAAAFLSVAPSHAQDACQSAKRDWEQLGETGFNPVSPLGLANAEATRNAYQYLSQSHYAAQVIANCPPAMAPVTEQAVSQAVRAGASELFTCVQLQTPVDRIKFLRDYVAGKKPKTGDPVTGLEVSGWQLNTVEADYWTRRLADLNSNKECAAALGLEEKAVQLSGLKSNLDFIGARVRAAGQSCQAGISAYQQAASAVAQKASDVPAALAARTALQPQLASTRTACEPFGPQTKLPLDSLTEDLDIALGAAAPGCSAIITSARSALAEADGAIRAKSGSFAIAARTKIQALFPSAGQSCAAYPGLSARLKRAEAEMNAIAGSPKDK